MAGLKGDEKHLKRLQRAIATNPKLILQALYVAGQEVEIAAERSITEGSISGAGHVPSLPGEPPNADTRFLDTHIETTVERQNPPLVHVTSQAHYSAFLEFGTSRMAERPFMRPALFKKRARIRQLVEAAVAKALGDKPGPG